MTDDDDIGTLMTGEIFRFIFKERTRKEINRENNFKNKAIIL